VAVVLDPTAQTIEIIAAFFGLTTPDVMAHIHCCAPLGTNVGVATTLPSFAGFPLGVTQGTYLSPLFSLQDPTFYNPAFVTLEGGLPQAETALIAGIENEQAYFNIHTTQFPGGEIRTQLLPEGVPGGVPEPSTWAMMLVGFAGLGYAGYRRARAGHATLAA
jgi:CHRD domain-containing protein/PEP-CTERM motif-containing protein